MEPEAAGWRPVERPCEDCGGQIVADLEPFEDDPDETYVAGATETRLEGSEWCTNLSCTSNYALSGVHRVGVNDYVCLTCGERLRTPTGRVAAHLRAHRDQEPRSGSYTYL